MLERAKMSAAEQVVVDMLDTTRKTITLGDMYDDIRRASYVFSRLAILRAVRKLARRGYIVRV